MEFLNKWAQVDEYEKFFTPLTFTYEMFMLTFLTITTTKLSTTPMLELHKDNNNKHLLHDIQPFSASKFSIVMCD